MAGKFPRTATITLVALTTLAWLAAAATGYDEIVVPATFGFIPARFSGIAVPWAAAPAFLTPLTATFVHSGVAHLAFNMLMLVWCGMAVERVLGSASLILIYVVGAYAAAICQWAVDPMSVVPMIGASGAISAIVGAFALSFGRAKQVTRSARANRYINALWLLAAWIVLQLAIGWLAGGEGYLLATPAHIGGFLAGILLQRPLLIYRYRSA